MEKSRARRVRRVPGKLLELVLAIYQAARTGVEIKLPVDLKCVHVPSC